MDFHAHLEPADIERRLVSLEQRVADALNVRQLLVAHPRIIRTAKTIVVGDAVPTYPIQGVGGGNTFPFVFLDSGFFDGPGLNAPEHLARRSTKSGNVLALSSNWIPPETVIEVFQSVGLKSAKPGQWWTAWTDQPRLGIATEDIDIDGNGHVLEYLPNNYGTETVTTRTWLVRNKFRSPLIEANTWVEFQQLGSVAYAGTGRCSPEST